MKCKCGNEMSEIGTGAGGVFKRWCSECGRIFSRSMNPSLPGECWDEPSYLTFRDKNKTEETKKKIISILSCFDGELAADKIIEALDLTKGE